MADFCKGCHADMFGPGLENDLSGLSTADDTAHGLYTAALCEGCGPILVDHTGKRVATWVSDDEEKGHYEPEAS